MEAGRTYFETLLKVKQTLGNMEWLDYIPKCVSQEQNDGLCCPPDNEEIKKTLFGMKIDNAPRPDDMGVNSFIAYWDIVRKDLCEAIKEFLCKSIPPLTWKSTFIALIPKTLALKSFADFRPISLCNVYYKVISRLVSRRLKHILPLIISQE
ncbi:unnamed protein product [Spirodela intermedia]|uniref:Uncharacterized protein n=1 Tax=Spirodela intermedia TaxID=51605 RepID=A0A7I8L6A0_SPIIN|nr:unnamed protein product [Spirodela intermedia]